MTVLVVDDDESFRRGAKLLLEVEGYEVVGEAEDGMSGIEAARRLAPDMVLLDVQLPDIDCFDVAAGLTANAGAPAVILPSSQDPHAFGTLIRRSGARGFIPKAEITGARLAALLP